MSPVHSSSGGNVARIWLGDSRRQGRPDRCVLGSRLLWATAADHRVPNAPDPFRPARYRGPAARGPACVLRLRAFCVLRLLVIIDSSSPATAGEVELHLSSAPSSFI